MSPIAYQAATPPGPYDPYDLYSPYRCTKKQADVYFQWHQSILQERIDYLLETCHQDSGVPISVLRDFPSGTVPFWRWFLSVAEVVPITEEQKEQIQANLAGQLRNHPPYAISQIVEDMTPSHLLSSTTEIILRDVAMYVGDGFTRISPKIYWEIFRQYKSDYCYNHAVIRGFTPPGIRPGYDQWFEPIGMVRVQALHLLRHEAAESDLFNLINLWSDGL